MSGNEIRLQIDKNNEKIRKALNTFILTDEIQKLMEENDILRSKCEHEFIDGTCKYCDAFEGVIYD